MRNNIIREDLDLLINYLKNNDPILTQSKNVRLFEEKWSEWLGVKHSVFVNSGASANLLTLAILKIKYPQGGEVIVPPLTWVSDIAAVIQNGFNPVFVDIDPKTLAMNSQKIKEAVTSNTRAVFLSHIQGFDGLDNDLLKFLGENSIPLIEDVCESHGATHNKCKLGSIGWISNFSFYYAHHMSTIEGGMICTNDKDVYEQARMLRSHGMVREADCADLKNKYHTKYPELNPDFIFAYSAYNVRNTEIGGILGLSQLKRLDQAIERRTENFKRFLSKIDCNIYRTNFKIEGSSNYAFNLILNEPDENFVNLLMKKMKESGVEFRRGSAGGGNQLRQPYLSNKFPFEFWKKFPETEHIHFNGFYIGNFPDLKLNEVDEICSIVNSI